ncbi:Arylsulfotransferase (ASST) [Halogranum gelatinilyticum]|uniref:Arylsulfotransferase (ASST) n=1 Tax=Halogranum gelatinilyticum TaxID=660521 RepID=A0A1G9VUP6_9EURY|nr:arylsulfotransferase family protein [Halogranum gelatinilyticum]SDM75701.1 Arylsulfotransferase (ASST) [Halogranum gelatinilyticum]
MALSRLRSVLDSRRPLRIAFVLVVLVAVGLLAVSYVTAPPTFPERVERGGTIAEPANGTTVVATQGLGREGWHQAFVGDSPGELVAVAPDGSVAYYDDTYQAYWDVDPVEGTESTVEYVAAEYLSAEQCDAATDCYRNTVLRTNVSTGETREVYGYVVRNEPSIRWHDVDRVDETHLAVADISEDRAFVVDTETGIVEWQWDAQSDLPLDSGGEYPTDWTHINDVEILDDGRFMLSLRNQDRVVFVDPETGVQEDWTLGEEDNYDILYEQHNPDYLPESQGGPAVLVADSHNNRVVEYQRVDGEWEQTWQYGDAVLQWPRDGDRLPNGHTLVTDSNGDRVIEVDESGDVVWKLTVNLPYEAERLGTGDESTGGPSAASADLQSHEAGDGGGGGLSLRAIAYAIVPGEIILGLGFVLPGWMGFREALVVGGLVATLGLWAVLELYWAPWSVSLHKPVRFRRKE